jgi:hypothetical protein
MTKTVLTYSWLARKAMAMHRKDKAEYEKLVAGGSIRLVRGLDIDWNMSHSSHQSFTLRVGGRRYCTIYGILRDGKVYSRYELRVSPTTYKKRITDKYLPLTLPEGFRSRQNVRGPSTPCLLHNADGSVAVTTKWTSGRRGRTGEIDSGDELVICDTTGKFCGDSKTVDDLRLDQYYEDNRPMLGWFHSAARNRTEWINSIKAIPEGMCDHVLMGKVAAKAYLTASRMVEKYPHLRLVLFPAIPSKKDVSSLHDYRHGDENTPRTVMRWTERGPSGTAELYFLPEVYLYWEDGETDESGRVAWKGLSMTIPPHGNPLLDPTDRAALSGYTRRIPKRHGWDDAKQEMPYHSLLAWKPGSTRWKTVRGGFDKNNVGETFDPNFTNTFGEQDKELVLWHQHPDMVLVKTECPQRDDCEMPLPVGYDFAMKPEDVAMRFEEKLLLDSLPLC